MDRGGDGASSGLIERREVVRSGPSRCRRHAPSQHSYAAQRGRKAVRQALLPTPKSREHRIGRSSAGPLPHRRWQPVCVPVHFLSGRWDAGSRDVLTHHPELDPYQPDGAKRPVT